ncbi:MAG: YlbF family regulator [Clostridia bacterium]|nr:YlbF family regulator [Clostridia bacterium]
MKVYDTANQLAEEIKNSEEYVTYKTTREIINLKPDLKEKLKQFEEMRYKLQIEMMQSGKEDSDKSKELQNLYAELIEIDEAKKYFEAELKFNVMLADVNKIIGNAVKDLM